MYTSVVGTTFLKEYNRIHGKNFTAKQFFDKVLFKELFDHKKYLLWIQNSPFVQGIGKKTPYFNEDQRVEKLEKFHEKVSLGERDASIAIGFPASETKEFATTSGLVSDIKIPTHDEQIYASWIGGSLSAGIAGGYSLLFNHPEIAYYIYEGWAVYRKYLNNSVSANKLPPNKLFTWNGQWLNYRLGKNYRPDFDFVSLLKNVINRKEGNLTVDTIAWSELFFSLSYYYPEQNLITYVSSLGKTNKTIGFIPFQLKSGKKLIEIYNKLVGGDFYLQKTSNFEYLFGLHIKRACELGCVGLQALEPRGLRKYFGKEVNIDLVKPRLNPKKNEPEEQFNKRKAKEIQKDKDKLISFYIYKTWLIAMLSKNKDEISDFSQDIARTLVQYRSGDKSGSTKHGNIINKDLFGNKHRNNFIEGLTKIIEDEEVDLSIVNKMNELRDRVHYMTREDFAYFILLLKFDYAYQNRVSQGN